MAKLLILAALPEEADAVFADAAAVSCDADGFSRRQVSQGAHHIDIVTTGLGKVNAALAAGLFGARADMVFMAGTCGALDAAAGAYWIAQAVQHDYGAAESTGFRRYRAGDWPMGAAGDLMFAAMPDHGLGLPHAHIASGDSFVADPVAAAEMRGALGVHLVDMEVAAVAQAALRMQKPWAAIKSVTDDANGDSGGDFHANLIRAARLSADAMERLVTLL